MAFPTNPINGQRHNKYIWNGEFWEAFEDRINMITLRPTQSFHDSIEGSKGDALWFQFEVSPKGGVPIDSDIFEIVSDGLKIKKPGHVFVSANQDIITSASSGYSVLAVYKNKSQNQYQLSGYGEDWKFIHIATTIDCNIDDVINFKIWSHVGQIVGLDWNQWSFYNFIWSSK